MFFDPSIVDVVSSQLIGGRSVPGSTTRSVRSPSDPGVVREVSWASIEQVDEAVRNARQAWRTSQWGTLPPRERAKVLQRWADLVDAHAEEIAKLESLMSTRIYGEAMARDVKVVSGVLRYFSEFADKIDGTVTPTPRDSLSLVVHEPYGVVAAISPWNFPIILSAWKFAPALAAGNAVVLKPSELTPFATVRIAQLGAEAGLPRGLLNVIHGDGAVGEALVRHPDVDYVTFTGSSATGARIMSAAANSGLKPVSLELGGKGPQLVFGDTPDPDRLAQLIARGITYNSGQVCFAGSRLVVQRDIAESLLDKVVKAMQSVRFGPTWDSGTTMPPIINARQLARIETIVGASVSAGATRIAGGERIERNGANFFAPTVLALNDLENPAFREEIFGPVLAVQTFDEPEEGVSLANHPDFGLTASVHTRDISKALWCAQRIESGTVWINDWGRRTDFTAPFGGYKRSGIGKDMGRAGFEKYLKSKSIWVEIGDPQ